jgi:predicted ester cyclase
VKQLVADSRTALPDLHFSIEEPIVEGDWVSFRWSTRGTHRGEWLGVKPTGKPVMIFGTSTSRFVAGKAVETWAHWDVLEALQQLGAATEIHVSAQHSGA